MALPFGKIAAGTLVLVAAFAGAYFVLNGLPTGGADRRPVLAEVPPLKPLSRTSLIVTPAAISLTAIRDAMEQAAPKTITGKRADAMMAQFLSNGEISWNINRGPLTVTGRPDTLVGVGTAERHLAGHR